MELLILIRLIYTDKLDSNKHKFIAITTFILHPCRILLSVYLHCCAHLTKTLKSKFFKTKMFSHSHFTLVRL